MIEIQLSVGITRKTESLLVGEKKQKVETADLKKDAMAFLWGLSKLEAKPFHESLVNGSSKVSLVKEGKKSYGRAWRTVQAQKATTVYAAVKIAAFGSRLRGRVTGTTTDAMGGYADETGAAFGIINQGITWPSEAGGRGITTARILELLGVLWKLDALDRGEELKFSRQRRRRRAGMPAAQKIKELTFLEWDSQGLRIRWPANVKKWLRLQDYNVPPEPIQTKRYYKDRQEKFFLMSVAFMNSVEKKAMAYIMGTAGTGEVATEFKKEYIENMNEDISEGGVNINEMGPGDFGLLPPDIDSELGLTEE